LEIPVAALDPEAMAIPHCYMSKLRISARVIVKSTEPSKAKMIAKEFLESDLEAAEVTEIKPYKSTTSLARSLGRILHGSKALDPDNNIVVKSDEKKVYLIRKTER
jgi:hypothetical protein